MARDFTKNVANYLSLGIGAVGALINGAAAISIFARLQPDIYTGGTTNDNAALSLVINSTTVGVSLGVDDSGATKTVRVTGRSVSGDARQARNGTSGVTLGAWARIGGVLNFAGDTITPYFNGAAEGGGAVVFANAAFTLGTPSIPDMVGGYDAPPATVTQFDGRIAEVAIWAADIGAAGFAQLERMSPRLIAPASLVFHLCLTGRPNPLGSEFETDGIGGVIGAVTGGLPAAADPLILQPRGPIYVRTGSGTTLPFSVILEMEFNGRGNGWTDISADLAEEPIKLRYGIAGNKPRDRVASTGTLDFVLDNSTGNSAGTVGYYSTSNLTARRANFRLGNRVRLVVTADGERFYKFVGRLDVANPAAGLFGARTVACQAVDWMDAAASENVTGLAVQFAKRSDELFSLVVASMAMQPQAIEIVEPGNDTYEVAFDTAEDESTPAMSELQKIALSELGLVYVKGDQVAGETLVFEGRSLRGTARTNVATFTDVTGLVGLKVGQAREHVINHSQIVNHPKTVDAAATTVLYDLQAKVPIGANATITLLGPYRDPNQRASRVGGTAMVTPLPFTDYTGNTLADGTGTDLTTLLLLETNYGGSGVRYSITNTSGLSGFITKLQARGKGVYSYQTVVLEGNDAASQSAYGKRTEKVDQHYQSNPAVGLEIAQYLVSLYKDPSTQVHQAEVFAPANDEALIADLMRREISDRIGLAETVSGVTDVGTGATTIGFFINQVEIEIDHLDNFRVGFLVAPADKFAYWLLEIPGATELDASTILGFGQIVGHVDVAAVSTHADTAHADSAHVDVAHGDQVHGDGAGGHLDDPFQDVPHVDSAHVDSAHVDSAHVDSAHVDGHQDSAHGDDAGTGHTDHVDHVDGVHVDQTIHGDSGHIDNAHEDHTDSTPHGDTAHGDDHGDTAHVDTDHVDEAHEDHTDGGHTDTPLINTPHSDTLHSDSPHADDHGDTAHGDI